MKVILFDFDGVVVKTDSFTVALERDLGITYDDVQPFFNGPFNDTTIGKTDLKEVIEPYLKGWGWQDTADDLLEYWFKEESYYDHELVEFIQTLRAQGIECFLATNQEKYRTRYIREVMGFADKFDGMFVSCELESRKPYPEFFAKTYERLAPVPKSEILFLDDLPENVAAAKAFGLEAEVYKDLASFKMGIKNYV